MYPSADTLPAMALLAAGGSRRLGRPKQLLTRDGVSLIRHFASLALQLPLARLVVVTGGAAAKVQAELNGLTLDIVDNPDWESGMASSVRTVVQALAEHSGPCLFATVDQPALSLDHLQHLLEASRRYPGQDIASAYSGLAGVPAILRRSTWLQGRHLLGDTGLRRLLRMQSQPVHTIPAPELALDVDTPASLQQAIQLGWLDPLADS